MHHETQFQAYRAENLALMYLTRRNDLLITKQEIAPDFLVALTNQGTNSGRVFGVEVKATLKAPKQRESELLFRINYTFKEYSLYQVVIFPVCLFFFTMEDDLGYFKWIKQPVIGPEGDTGLALNFEVVKRKEEYGGKPVSVIERSKLSPLTQEEIDKVVSQVDDWYDYEFLNKGYDIRAYSLRDKKDTFEVVFNRRALQQEREPTGENKHVPSSTRVVVVKHMGELSSQLKHRNPADTAISDELFEERAKAQVRREQLLS
jgi:hypothetical protein